jgi:bidirectional [NiFe] hydrogenase diaphorase subunit
MLGYASRPSAPSTDKRWKIVDAAMRRHGYAPDSLIEVLHAAQESFGFLSCDALRYVALSLRLPYSKVMGVATFYNHFQMKPAGKHTCVVCTGTACYINGAPALLRAVREHAGIGSGETSADGELSLLTARCIGACGLAPVAVVDDEVCGKTTPEKLTEKLRSLAQPVEA